MAELNGSGTLVSRFVYATHANIPDYVVQGGVTYRVVTDHLGSLRLVVNANTGAVVQRMNHDEFGNVTVDLVASGFTRIPFGFAGGLYDADTALVRFGARDYDPETGRWTTKDSIGFTGGHANLYSYALDPVNFVDISGLEPPQKMGRDPDYIVVTVSGGYGKASLGRTYYIDRYNRVYEGVFTAGGKVGGFVAAAAAGWILCKKTPSEERLKSFLTGWSTSGGGGAGPGAGLVRADGGEMAMEIGVTTPGGGATRGYGKFIGNVLHEAARNGIPGGDMIGRYADWTQFWINYNRNGGRSR